MLTRKQIEKMKTLSKDCVDYLEQKLGEEDPWIHFWGSLPFLIDTALDLMDQYDSLSGVHDALIEDNQELRDAVRDILKHPIYTAQGTNAKDKLQKLIEEGS